MDNAWLEKYQVPVTSSAAIRRTRLINLIQSLSSRSILFIHGPVGYGKTTAVVQWLAARNIKAAWLSLDEYDNTADFYKGLLLSLLNGSDKTTEAPPSPISEVELEAEPLRYTLEALLKFDFDERFQAVVIDGFHWIQDSAVSLSLPLLRSRLPASIRLIVLSRNPPDDRLHEHIVKETIRQISYTELAFTVEEVTRLFTRHPIKLTGYEAAKIHMQTKGWPVALGALILLSDKSFGANGQVTSAHRCVKDQLCDFWTEDVRDALLKMSVCTQITPSLCEKLTLSQNTWDILIKLCRKTGLVMREHDECYHYHILLRDFLLFELEADEQIDKVTLYRKMAEWHLSTGDIVKALTMASRYGDVAFLESIVRANDLSQGRSNMGAAHYAEAIRLCIVNQLPMEQVAASPRLCLESWFSTFAMGLYEEQAAWKALVEKHQANGAFTLPQDRLAAFMFCYANPERVWEEEVENVAWDGSVFTLTYNLPFFHRAQRDFAQTVLSVDDSMKMFLQILPPLWRMLIEGGLQFERGEIASAKDCARRVYEKLEKESPPELYFSCLTLLSEAYWVEGNVPEAAKNRKKIGEMINEKAAFYLSPNFDALATNIELYNGDPVSAVRWLEMGNEEQALSLCNSYQSLTTAKALIVAGSLTKALSFLSSLQNFFKSYQRVSDYTEAGVLKSVCLWRLKKPEEAVEALREAVESAQTYAITLPIIRQGVDIAPVLQKMINKLKSGYAAETLNRAFVNQLYLGARGVGGYYGGFFAKAAGKPLKLSPKQMTILDYMAQNLSHREMSELSGTKITTIKDHVEKLYLKLGVNNAIDALLKAKELGLL